MKEMNLLEEAKERPGPILLPSELNEWNCSRPRRWRVKPILRRRVKLAHHDTISHMVGAPCIHFTFRLSQRLVFPVLEHEMLHCAMMRIGEESGNIGELTIDGLISDLDVHRKVFKSLVKMRKP